MFSLALPPFCLGSELLQETQLAEKLEVWGSFIWLLFIWDSAGFLCYFMNSSAGTEEEMGMCNQGAQSV